MSNAGQAVASAAYSVGAGIAGGLYNFGSSTLQNIGDLARKATFPTVRICHVAFVFDERRFMQDLESFLVPSGNNPVGSFQDFMDHGVYAQQGITGIISSNQHVKPPTPPSPQALINMSKELVQQKLSSLNNVQCVEKVKPGIRRLSPLLWRALFLVSSVFACHTVSDSLLLVKDRSNSHGPVCA